MPWYRLRKPRFYCRRCGTESRCVARPVGRAFMIVSVVVSSLYGLALFLLSPKCPCIGSAWFFLGWWTLIMLLQLGYIAWGVDRVAVPGPDDPPKAG